MRRIIQVILFGAAVAASPSCEQTHPEAEFKDLKNMTINDYLVKYESQFSGFLKILKADSLDRVLSAYNPKGDGYTLFLPTNQAIDDYIKDQGDYTSLSDLLGNRGQAAELARYHILPQTILTRDFPFGAIQENNLYGDRLMVSFVIGTDSSYYKINNLSPIIKEDIELSNGCIHILGGVLAPITYSSYDWLARDPGLSIFRSLIDTTGLDDVIHPDDGWWWGYDQSTLLVEPDSVYNRFGIFSLEDLITEISPEYADYTQEWNRLYYYAAYHILHGMWFLNEWETLRADHYSTHIGEAVFIDGSGKEIKINPGREIFDTLIDRGDTTIIDYIGFLYDVCNVVTRNGAIHFINRVLTTDLPPGIPPDNPPDTPTVIPRESFMFQFYEESLLENWRYPGEYLIDDTSMLDYITWSGTDLYYVKCNAENCRARNDDFLLLDGDFYISYTIPEIDTGKYTVFLEAEAFSEANALVDVFLDGQQIGSTVDLRSGGSQWNPFRPFYLGEVIFLNYEDHRIEIEASVPGRFIWDYVFFESN